MSDLDELNLQEELMKQIEEMQAEIENLRAQNKQSVTSSEIAELKQINSDLRKDNQQKSATIKQLNEKIGKLSESDKQLENAKKLEEQSKKELESAKRLKSEADEIQQSVKERAQKLNKGEIALEARKTDFQTEIEKEAQFIIKNKKTALEAEYEREKRNLEADKEEIEVQKDNYIKTHKTIYRTAIGYGVFITLLTAIRSKPFISDFKAFFFGIAKILNIPIDGALQLIEGFYMDMSGVPATILSVLLVVALVVGIAGIIFGLIFLFYKKCLKYCDIKSLAVLLASIALVIVFADVIAKYTTWNCLVLILVINILNIAGRTAYGWVDNTFY